MGHKPNIIGNRYGRLVVLSETTERKSGGCVVWKCQCDCGNITTATTRSLLSEDKNQMKRSCGCLWYDTMSKRRKDIIGNRYGRLTVMKHINKSYYMCKCDCGNIKKIRSDGLVSGNVVSCGCYNKEIVRLTHTKHGMSYTKAYKNNDAMKRSNNLTRLSKYLTNDEQDKLLLYYTISEYMGPDWEVDHIIPISKGGLHHPDNLQIITKRHNRKKSFKDDYQIPKELIFKI